MVDALRLRHVVCHHGFILFFPEPYRYSDLMSITWGCNLASEAVKELGKAAPNFD